MAHRLVQIIIAIVLLLVAVVGGAAAWVTLFPDTLKPPLQRFLSTELGQPVELRGPLRIGLGLVTTVEVEGVRIAAPEWAREPDLATLDRLRVGIDLWAYVRNRVIRITELVLDAPRIALERDAQGRTSWPSAKGEATAKQGGGSFPQLDALTITGGHVAYLDAVSAVDVAADVATTKPGAGSFGLKIDGGGTIRTDPVQLTLQVQPTAPISQPNIPLEITGALQAAGSQLKLTGQLREPATMTGLALDLDVASDDPRPLSGHGRQTDRRAAAAAQGDGTSQPRDRVCSSFGSRRRAGARARLMATCGSIWPRHDRALPARSMRHGSISFPYRRSWLRVTRHQPRRMRAGAIRWRYSAAMTASCA